MPVQPVYNFVSAGLNESLLKAENVYSGFSPANTVEWVIPDFSAKCFTGVSVQKASRKCQFDSLEIAEMLLTFIVMLGFWTFFSV